VCSWTCLPARPAVAAAAAWSTVWNCVPAQISIESARRSTTQLSGSIGACARKGSSYSASSTCAAEASAASGSPALRATRPGVAASCLYSARRPALESPALGPRSHSTASASRPRFAAQKPVAITATPEPTSTTCLTPGTASAAAESMLRAFAPKTGAWRTSAVSMPGRCTSIANTALPLTLAGVSRRFVGLPIRRKSFGSLSGTSAGGVSFAAASASSP